MATDVGGEWNRDAAYHPWIVKVAAEHAGDVLDVGCGDGLLALRLAEVSRSVVGIDRDPAAIGLARRRLELVPNTDATVSEFGSEWGLTPDSFDVITMVSVLHELPLVPTLERVAELLKPGGTLLVVGRAAPRSWLDHLTSWASLPYARALEAVYTWRGMYRPEFESGAGAEPSYSYVEVADAARELLPGVELRRGLLGRYRLRWSKPVPVAAHDVDVEAMIAAAGGRVGAGGGGADGARDAAGEASAGTDPDAHVLGSDDIDELSRMFEQTREVPTVEAGGAADAADLGEAADAVDPGEAADPGADVRRSA